MQTYVEGHPGFAAGSLGWVIVGAILFVTAVVVLIFSELRVVLVVRDQVAPEPSLRAHCSICISPSLVIVGT